MALLAMSYERKNIIFYEKNFYFTKNNNFDNYNMRNLTTCLVLYSTKNYKAYFDSCYFGIGLIFSFFLCKRLSNWPYGNRKISKNF